MALAPDWPIEDELFASSMWIGGATAGQISKAMDYRYTRNSVLGKMNRMRLMRNPMVPKTPRPGPKPKLDLNEAIKTRHERGSVPSEIAGPLKIPTAQVIEALTEMGIDPKANVTEQYRIHPMWDDDEDDRRIRFAEKARRGAAMALRAAHA